MSLGGIFLDILFGGFLPGAIHFFESSSENRIFFWLLTLIAVTIAWVPFRARDLESTMLIWSGMSGLNGLSLPRTVTSALGHYAELLLGFGLRVDSDVFRALFWSAGTTNALCFAIALIIALFVPNTYQWVRRLKPVLENHTFPEKALPKTITWRPSLIWAFLIVALFCASIYYQAKPSAFLYFQF